MSDMRTWVLKVVLSYMDPEYAIAQDLSEKSGVLRCGAIWVCDCKIQDNKNLVEWSQTFMASESRLHELMDPSIGDSFDFGQFQIVVKWCTQREWEEKFTKK